MTTYGSQRLGAGARSWQQVCQFLARSRTSCLRPDAQLAGIKAALKRGDKVHKVLSPEDLSQLRADGYDVPSPRNEDPKELEERQAAEAELEAYGSASMGGPSPGDEHYHRVVLPLVPPPPPLAHRPSHRCPAALLYPDVGRNRGHRMAPTPRVALLLQMGGIKAAMSQGQKIHKVRLS